jgi:5-oxopent-3-ene-1,2,5-tricarboxylate decarboxylase/2-hydroxyhepta-2,4-diene-1,7-dioate isomerase
MKRVRVLHQGRAVWGQPEDDTIVLEDGSKLAEAEVSYLTPAEPGKIIATHLAYRSRCIEYKMARPPEVPSYFMKPPSTLSAHRAPVARPRGCRFLNYEGEIAVVIGRRCRWPTIGACTTSATPTAARCCASRARTASARWARPLWMPTTWTPTT